MYKLSNPHLIMCVMLAAEIVNSTHAHGIGLLLTIPALVVMMIGADFSFPSHTHLKYFRAIAVLPLVS